MSQYPKSVTAPTHAAVRDPAWDMPITPNVPVMAAVPAVLAASVPTAAAAADPELTRPAMLARPAATAGAARPPGGGQDGEGIGGVRVEGEVCQGLGWAGLGEGGWGGQRGRPLLCSLSSRVNHIGHSSAPPARPPPPVTASSAAPVSPAAVTAR